VTELQADQTFLWNEKFSSGNVFFCHRIVPDGTEEAVGLVETNAYEMTTFAAILPYAHWAVTQASITAIGLARRDICYEEKKFV
jgi:hypothetical protein